MKKQIKSKPISISDLKKLNGVNPITDLILNSAVRIMECKRLIDEWNGKDNFADIFTKKSKSHKNRIFLNEKAREALVILQKKEKGISIRTLQRRIQDVSNETGIEFTAHNLRATALTMLIENGVNLVAVQNIANHASIEQTAQYIKLSEMSMISAVDTLLPQNTLMGMTPFEMRAEIIKLRKQLEREKNANR